MDIRKKVFFGESHDGREIVIFFEAKKNSLHSTIETLCNAHLLKVDRISLKKKLMKFFLTTPSDGNRALSTAHARAYAVALIIRLAR